MKKFQKVNDSMPTLSDMKKITDEIKKIKRLKLIKDKKFLKRN